MIIVWINEIPWAREILSERPRRAGWVALTGGAMGTCPLLWQGLANPIKHGIY